MIINSKRGQISLETGVLIAGIILSAMIVTYYLVAGSSETAKNSVKGVESAKNYSLKGFELDDTYKYMMYRLSSAGAKVPIFSREAIMAVHDHTGGRPREINKIAMLALQYGALNKSKRITAELILRIYADQYGML